MGCVGTDDLKQWGLLNNDTIYSISIPIMALKEMTPTASEYLTDLARKVRLRSDKIPLAASLTCRKSKKTLWGGWLVTSHAPLTKRNAE